MAWSNGYESSYFYEYYNKSDYTLDRHSAAKDSYSAQDSARHRELQATVGQPASMRKVVDMDSSPT